MLVLGQGGCSRKAVICCCRRISRWCTSFLRRLKCFQYKDAAPGKMKASVLLHVAEMWEVLLIELEGAGIEKL